MSKTTNKFSREVREREIRRKEGVYKSGSYLAVHFLIGLAHSKRRADQDAIFI
ncbi:MULTISPECIES: hypothetical protein [unclassified Rhizobium]|uniref:hypothetical protein n=1 Tax=unclassified Rhizobium TaxID=2613769 RepID=UPI000B33362B|nr:MULTISPECIES: hypothetical protein [unclassified Rhizobium]